jgi:hypothetical protein
MHILRTFLLWLVSPVPKPRQDCRLPVSACHLLHSLTLAGSVGGMDKSDDYEERIKRIVDQASPLSATEDGKMN